MNEEIIKVVDELGKRFGIVIDWTNQNITPYLQDLMARYIQYDLCYNIIWLIINILTVVIGIPVIIKLTRYCAKKSRDSDRYDSVDGDTVKCILSGIAIGCLSIWILLNFFNIGFKIENIIQDKYIPEKTIYEYITTNINNDAL